MAGIVYAHMHHIDPLMTGTAMALLCLQSQHTVCEQLNETLLIKTYKEIKKNESVY